MCVDWSLTRAPIAEALIGSYRGNVEDHDWNWVGPGSSGFPSEPTDGNGYGTHTIGTISGQAVSFGIGCAPAKAAVQRARAPRFDKVA